MANRRLTDEELETCVIAFNECGRRVGPTAYRLKIPQNTLRSRLSDARSRGLDVAGTKQEAASAPKVNVPGRIETELKNGIMLVGSDAHYLPGEASTAHRAFVHFIKELQPDIIIKNGDMMDGARISRHPAGDWESEKRPSVLEELEVCQDRMAEIEDAGGKRARYYFPLGNHDARYESRLVDRAPEYAGIHGTRLKDHFPNWAPCWSVWVNSDVVVKHRYSGGIHATHNNTLKAGKSIFTGHLHSLKVTPYTDYNGTRFGVDTGTLAEPYGEQFLYVEDGPRNWRSGFIVATFDGGRLLWPEPCHVIDRARVEFRGKIHDV